MEIRNPPRCTNSAMDEADERTDGLARCRRIETESAEVIGGREETWRKIEKLGP